MPPKKKVAAIVKVALNAGAATPAPPVGTALGPHGVNIMEFCKRYNAETEAMRGTIVPVDRPTKERIASSSRPAWSRPDWKTERSTGTRRSELRIGMASGNTRYARPSRSSRSSSSRDLL